jgi:hypothetical protein
MANDVHINGVSFVLGQLAHLPEVHRRVINNSLTVIGQHVKREAKLNAPKSPTMTERSATLKRKKRTARRTTPGGLEKSIEYEVKGGTCSVFVASNSYAGKYAKRIHDEKGKSWHKRGPGTIAKGSRADDKFVERAIRDNQDKFLDVFKSELRKALPK